MTKKILLVDDEEGIRKVLAISLTDGGYHVFTAQNGEDALKIFREERPPIILTDIKMPGMDGIELLQEIKGESPDTEVIMITGHGDMDLAIQSLKYEATDFITKPINDEVLEIALKRAEERISLKSQIKEYTENLEKLVEEKTRQLLEAERLAAMGETVAAIAHAIKNITGGLTGGTFVLEKGIELESERYLKQGWEMIKGNVARVKGLAMDLLTYAKGREPGYQMCDPNRPVLEVADLITPRAREYGVHILVDINEDIPHLLLDPEGIQRCLLNLVTNAIDACDEMPSKERPGKVVLRSLIPTEAGEEWAVEYQVKDNGCGMEEEISEKVFQRFFSTKGSRGTGLGLMITKKIIDEHSGTIHLTSEKGKGTTVYLRLPKRDHPKS
jgi:signal transduction histidine kinase